MGAFARDRAERKQWWDDRLWLQMLLVTAICIAGSLLGGMGLPEALGFTAAFVAVVYLLGRLMLGRSTNASSRRS
jgi:membrane protein implicated in regulation of membrane protease activity